jgi:hypothetical protein
LALSNEHAIAAARDALARQLGSIITMTTEDGEPMADVDIVRIGIYQPDEDDDPAAEHVENVASTLREESLDWLEGARRDDVEAERMPALADFVALCDDAHLIDWVRIQMAPPHDSVAGHNPTEAGG